MNSSWLYSCDCRRDHTAVSNMDVMAIPQPTQPRRRLGGARSCFPSFAVGLGVTPHSHLTSCMNLLQCSRGGRNDFVVILWDVCGYYDAVSSCSCRWPHYHYLRLLPENSTIHTDSAS